MKVSEFKKMGLEFVEGDKGTSYTVRDAAAFNSSGLFGGCEATHFEWRENTGLKPEFIGLIDAEIGEGDLKSLHVGSQVDRFDWDLDHPCPTVKWRPSLEQPKQWPDNSRIDAIGQNGNDWLHYGNTAQQVEALALKRASERMKVAQKEADDIGKGFVTRCVMMPTNPKFIDNETANAKVKTHIESLRPIFTQAMADAGELPPVGSLVDVVGKNGVELAYGEGEKKCEVLAHIENTAVIRMSFGLGCFSSNVIKASDTRTDREKAIDEMLKDSRCSGIVIEICIERLYDAGYRK